MPSTRKRTTKDGRPYYEIRVRVSRDRSELSTRWYVPDGWSAKAIERELAKQAADFERRCKAGEVLSRSERKDRDLEASRIAASILTLRQSSHYDNMGNLFSCPQNRSPAARTHVRASNACSIGTFIPLLES